MDELTPQEPEEAGVETRTPELAQIEAARVLADDALDRLGDSGFERDEVREWAKTYVAERGSGDVDSFVAWIGRQQRRGRT